VAGTHPGVNAVVLAGGPPDALAGRAAGAANKAFVPIGGVPLVERALRALRAVPRIERIVVVAPAATHALPALALADERRGDGPRMIESLRSGLGGFPADAALLVVDLPVLTPAAIDEVLDALATRDLDIAYTCLARTYHDRRYPQIPHTWARMREGQFCGGGVTAIKPRALDRLGVFLDALGAARKAPLRLAALFGWDVLARFAVGQLSIAGAERRATVILQAPVGAIQCTHAEIAVNVDRVSDIALAEALVQADTRASH
jgi:molybdopterin-guanine dinucleotide biosynthesis protein A